MQERNVAVGILNIKAKIGELLPAEQGKRTDKLPESDTGGLLFDSHTLSAYRKIFANKSKIEAYAESVDDVPTQGEFIPADFHIGASCRWMLWPGWTAAAEFISW